jgi:hypothetical protein
MTTETKMPETDPMLASGSVQWTDSTGIDHRQLADRAVLDLDIYLASQQRIGHNYKGRRNYAGLHWFSNTGAHVYYESMMERRALIWLDFTFDIVAIASQPMLMNFPDGTRHTPDYIALHADGRQVVYNVKPARFFTEKVRTQFANASALCRSVGWTHDVVSVFDPIVIGNIEWLAQFRQSRFAPTEALTRHLLDLPIATLTVGAAAALLTSLPATARLPALYNLAWYGHISLDLTRPLSTNTTTILRKARS